MALSDTELRELSEQLSTEKERLRDMEHDLASRELELQAQQIHINQQQSRVAENSVDSRFQSTITNLVLELNNIRSEMSNLNTRVMEAQPATTRVPPIFSAGNQLATSNSDPNLPRLSFKDILEGIPSFNGDNISVLKFVRACKRARDMFPATLEITLTRLLRNKLKGRAYTAVEDDSFVNINALSEKLKEVFGAAKSINQYRGELGNIIKNKNEHIIDYISRVKDLHSAIREEETDETGTISRTRSASLENETLECFIAGLPPNFRLRLKLEGCQNLAMAYANAVKIEKEIEKDRVNFKETRTENKNSSQSNVKTISTRDSTSCKHCNKTGHIIDDCWTKYPDKRPHRRESSGKTEPGKFDNKRISGEGNKKYPPCSYCKKLGHPESRCFAKLNDSQKTKSENEKSRSEKLGANRAVKASERPVRAVNTASEKSEPSTSN